MNGARNVVRALGSNFLRALAVACVALLLAVGIGPHTGRYRTLAVLSGSMQPAIPAGAVVSVRPERASQLRVGQIVTYRIPVDDHRVITHRVVKILEGGDRPVFVTKGDANSAPDQWVARVDGNKVWRVSHVVPYLGRVLNWLRKPTVHFVAVLLAPALFALTVLLSIWRVEPEGPEETGRRAPRPATPA